MGGGGGQSEPKVAQSLLMGSQPFSLGGKTPFQSFLGMAQQHSSHSGVSQAQGGGGHWQGAAGQGQAGTPLNTKSGRAALPGSCAAGRQPHQPHSHFPQ